MTDLPDTTTPMDKPCPFCGCAVMRDGWMGSKPDPDAPNGIGETIYGPECSECGATAPDMETWNRRPRAKSDDVVESVLRAWLHTDEPNPGAMMLRFDSLDQFRECIRKTLEIATKSGVSTREDRLEAALRRIADWSDAYPLEAFPEPDLKRAHAILQQHGMGVDSISASAMKHAIQGVGRIAKEALKDAE